MTTIFSFGLGIGTQNKSTAWLEVFYPEPQLNPDESLVKILKKTLGYAGGNHAIPLNKALLEKLSNAFLDTNKSNLASIVNQLKNTERPVIATILETDSPVVSVPEGYLKLHLLSHRLVKPNNINLIGIFGVLPNVAWTNEGAIDVNELAERQLASRLRSSNLSVTSIDKFPKTNCYHYRESMSVRR